MGIAPQSPFLILAFNIFPTWRLFFICVSNQKDFQKFWESSETPQSLHSIAVGCHVPGGNYTPPTGGPLGRHSGAQEPDLRNSVVIHRGRN